MKRLDAQWRGRLESIEVGVREIRDNTQREWPHEPVDVQAVATRLRWLAKVCDDAAAIADRIGKKRARAQAAT